MKNDITYEYRVFTNRLIDVESMEVGKCTSKVIKELKQKDKVDGRFFHTSDTDEWFFCWNGKLQKLNLKGNSDVNAALAEVRELIANANTTVSDAKKTATEAKNTAAEAKTAADAASAAVESIEAVEKEVELKADKSVVDELSAKVDAIKVPSLEGYATEVFVGEKIAEKVPTKVSSFENDANYLTHQDISDKQDVISDLETIRSGAALGATALQSDALNGYVTEDELATEIEKLNINSLATKEELKSCATKDDLNDYAKTSDIPENIVVKDDLNAYATTEYVDEKIGKLEIPEGVDLSGLVNQIEGKQDVIDDLEEIRDNAKNALKSVPDEYVTESELAGMNYATVEQVNEKQDVIEDLTDIRANAELAKTALQVVPDEYVKETELASKGYLTDQSLDNYYTKAEVYTQAEIDAKIQAINDLIDSALTLTNTILNA